MRNSALTEYITDVNGNRIEYSSGENALTATWYERLRAVDGTHYTDYVIYTDEKYYKAEEATREMVLRPKGTSEATFYAFANDGAVRILKGQMGNFDVANNGLSGGALQNTVFNANNKFYVGNDSTPHLFGEIIYGVETDSATGEVKLKQINGKTANFNIAAMQAYKDAVAAAGKLTLTLNVAGKKYTFTAP